MASNSLISSLEYTSHERKAEASGFSLKDFGKNSFYFAGSTATSAVTGFINTGIALGNIFKSEDFEYVDTGEWVQSWLGGEAADYYEEHQDFVDVAGLIVGSLVPGSLAIKGLKAGQAAIRGASLAKTLPSAAIQKEMAVFAAGKSSIYTRMTTGLKKVLVPEQELNLLTKEIRLGNHKVFSRTDYLKLAKESFHQNVLEAGVYEAATALTLAKNPTISSEDLDYFESLANAKSTIAFGILFGGAIGTLGSFAGKVAKSKKTFEEAAKEFNPYAFNSYSTVNANTFGDKIIDSIGALQTKTQQIKELELQLKTAASKKNSAEVSTKLKNKINLARASYEQAENKFLSELGNGISDPFVRDQFVALTKQADSEDLIKLFSGAERIKPISAGGNIYDPIEDFTIKFADVTEDSVAPFGESFNASTGVVEIPFETLNKMSNEEIYKYLDQLPPVVKVERTLDKIRGSKVYSTLQKDIEKFNRKEYANEYSLIEQTPLLDTLKDEAAYNSFINKATDAHWREIENLAEIIESAQKSLDIKTTEHYTMSKLYRLFTDADEELLTTLKKEYPGVHEAFRSSRAIRESFGPSQAYLSLKDGQLLRNETVVPFASDLGTVSVSGSTIKVGKTNFVYDIDSAKEVINMGAIEATARYALAERNPERILKGYFGNAYSKTPLTIGTYDFPRVNAALRVLETPQSKVKTSFNYLTVSGETKSFSSASELSKEIIKSKRLAVPKLTIQNKLSKKQIATILDTDEKWVNGDHLMRKELPKDVVFKSLAQKEANYFSNPRYLVIDYAKDFASEAEMKGFTAGQMKLFDEAFLDQEAFSAYMKESADLFPDINPQQVSGADTTTGFWSSNQAEYFKEQFKASGAILNTRHIKRQKEIFNHFGIVGQKVVNSPDAVAEVNVIQNLARQGRYYYYDNFDDLIQTELTRLRANNIIEAFTLNPALGIEMKRVFAGFFPGGMSSVTARGEKTLLHKEVVNSIREFLENVDLHINFDKKTLKLTRESEVELSDLFITAKDTFFNKPAIQELNDLASYSFNRKETGDFYKAWVAFNDQQMQARRTLAKRNGTNISFEERMVWAGPIDTEMYSHVYLVDFKDSSKIYGSKNRGVIVARSQADLDRKKEILQKTLGDQVNIRSPESVEDRLKALDAYDYDAAITENIVDSTMMNKGVLWEVMPEYNPNVVQEMLNAQIRAGRNLDRGYVQLKYQKEFRELTEAEKVFKSKGAISKSTRRADIGPWGQQIKAALDITHTGSYENYISAQSKIGDSLSKAYSTVKGLLHKASTSDLDHEWKLVDKYLHRTGLPRPYSEVTDYLKVNSNVSASNLEGFVARLNGIAATVMLRLDQTQAIVNAMSLPIMLGPEMQYLRKMIKGKAAEQLEELTTTTISKGLKEPTNMKLAIGAATEFWTHPNRLKMLEEFKSQGIVGNTLHEVLSAADVIALKPAMDENFIKQAGKKIITTLAKPADISEEFVKFVAARSAQKVLDLAPKGLINDRAKWSIIRNFVDKVHGNYVSSQRPTLFKGFAGQAIGLFQTYQFNLYQRLFAHLGNQSKTMALTMIGSQASIFGAQSLPGFQLLNQHIAEQSQDYNNLYSRANRNLGEDFSEWLIYGTGSNLFKPIPGLGGIDLYSRGDLTPRTPILIPTSLEEIPVVSLTKKSIGSFANAVAKSMEALSSGADPEVYKTIALEALAHNGLNRPLAGVSQMALGYRTTNSGKLLMTYDDSDNLAWTWTLKALGTKDLNEAIATNQYYSAMKYRTQRYDRMDKLGRTLRDIIRSNNGELVNDAYMHFLEEYVSIGGNQEDFGRWIQNQIVGANDSIINKLRNSNNSPEGRYLQSVLGADVSEF